MDGFFGELEIVVERVLFLWFGVMKEVFKDVMFLCKVGLIMVCGRVGIGKMVFF